MFAKVYLEITNVCNMNCSFCVGTKRKKHFLTAEEFAVLAYKIKPYTDFLYFHLMGEPTLHPLLGEFLDIAEKLGFKVIITTNGTLLDKSGEILLNGKSLFKVNISLHSFEANSNISEEDYFSTCFDFADKASNKGIITVFRLWNEGGENSLNDKIIGMMKHRFNGEWVENTKGIRIRKKLFIENGERFEWPLHSEIVSDKISCYGLKDHIGILCDGSVVPCCMDNDGNAILGNLYDNTLEEILNSEKTKYYRNMLENCKAPCEMCKTCGFAQNRFLHINKRLEK